MLCHAMSWRGCTVCSGRSCTALYVLHAARICSFCAHPRFAMLVTNTSSCKSSQKLAASSTLYACQLAVSSAVNACPPLPVRPSVVHVLCRSALCPARSCKQSSLRPPPCPRTLSDNNPRCNFASRRLNQIRVTCSALITGAGAGVVCD